MLREAGAVFMRLHPIIYNFCRNNIVPIVSLHFNLACAKHLFRLNLIWKM